MDLKKEILDFLKTKKDWDQVTQSYYIYVTLCKMFSYDCHFLFGSETEKKKIYNRKIDISNVDTFEIVCSSWCYIAKKLLKEIGIESEIKYDVLPHVYLIIDLNPYKIKMDPMKDGYDLTRIKIGSKSHGFNDLNHNMDFQEKIKKSADMIYKKYDIFADECVNILQQELKRYSQNKNFMTGKKFDNEVFIEKINIIINLINTTSLVKRFDDTDRYIDYLVIKLLSEWEKSKFHKYPFWNIENGTWDILNPIALEFFEKSSLCYKMSQQEEKYVIQQISYDEMNYYLDNYEGKIKGLYRGLTM